MSTEDKKLEPSIENPSYFFPEIGPHYPIPEDPILKNGIHQSSIFNIVEKHITDNFYKAICLTNEVCREIGYLDPVLQSMAKAGSISD